MHIIEMKQCMLFVAQYIISMLIYIYSFEYSGALYMFLCPILVSMASLLPAPLPRLRWRSCWGGGEGWRAGSNLGDLEQGRGDFGAFIWRVFIVKETSKLRAKKRKEKKCTISRSVNCIVNIVYSQ